MTIEEIKSAVEQKTGIPAALLYGTTEAEIFSYARQLAAFKGGAAPDAEGSDSSKTARDIFADYAAGIGLCEARQPESLIDRVESAIKEISPEYPASKDGGEAQHAYNAPSTAVQFGDWFQSIFG